MNGYDLSRNFVDFSFENPSKIKPNHYALYFFAIEHCNRLGWKKEFGLPTTMTMEAIGVKSYKTYITTFNDLEEFGFIKIVQRSKNQHSSNIIELVKNTKALSKALDKAFIKHDSKHSRSTDEITVSIDKPLTSKPINKETKEQREKDFNLFWSKYPTKKSKKDCLKKFTNLKQEDVDKILETIDTFVNHKPFESYNHPNPLTYINQERWNDEIQNNDKPKVNNPNNEKIITFTSNANPSRQQLPESEFLSFKERMQGGGYIFKIIE